LSEVQRQGSASALHGCVASAPEAAGRSAFRWWTRRGKEAWLWICITVIGEALGTDYFGLREPFTPQQEDYLVRTREFVDTEVLPVINGYWERAEFPWALIEKMAPLGIVGAGIEG
jgi:hypothetical protein